MSRNARRLPTLDGRSPANVPEHGPPPPPRERAGGRRPRQRTPRVCATGRSEAEDAVESTNFAQRSPGAQRRACCATGGAASTDPVPEARPVARSKESPGSSRRSGTSGRPARRGRPEGPSGRSLVMRSCHRRAAEALQSRPVRDTAPAIVGADTLRYCGDLLRMARSLQPRDRTRGRNQ